MPSPTEGKQVLSGNRCELCGTIVEAARAKYKQTKYCGLCAHIKKRQNSLDPLHPLDRRVYMRMYMRKYRQTHRRLSTKYVRAHRLKNRISQSQQAAAACSLPHRKSPTGAFYSASVIVIFLVPFISRHLKGVNFEGIQRFISHCSVTIVEITGLVVIGLFSWRHVRDLWREMRKTKNN